MADSPFPVALDHARRNAAGLSLSLQVRKCLLRRIRRLGLSKLQGADLEDIMQDVVCSVLAALRDKNYSATGLRSLIWLACRSALADWIDTRKPVEQFDALDYVAQTSSEREPLPAFYCSLAGDLALTALALSKGLPKADTARMLGLSRTALYRQIDTLRARLDLFDPAHESPENKARALVR